MHMGASGAHQVENGVQRNRFGRHRHARQAQPHGDGTAGRHTAAKVHVHRAQPGGVAKRGGVLQRTLQHLGVRHRHLGLTKADTT